jgi:hypothetical protein
MKKYIIFITIFLIFSVKSFSQSTVTQTYVDPCDNKIYTITIPFGQNQTIAIIRGQSRIVTLSDINTGAFQSWVNSVFATPCPVTNPVVQQTVANTVTQAAAAAVINKVNRSSKLPSQKTFNKDFN